MMTQSRLLSTLAILVALPGCIDTLDFGGSETTGAESGDASAGEEDDSATSSGKPGDYGESGNDPLAGICNSNETFDPELCHLDTAPGCAGSGVGLGFVALSELSAFMFEHLTLGQVDPDDRPFTRFLSLAHVQNAGLCGDQVEPFAQAMSEIVNSVSTEGSIAVPVEVIPGLLYAIDLRDYGWDVPSGGFADKWEAVIHQSPKAIVYASGESDNFADLREETQTEVPFLPADAFLHIAAQPPLYYELLDIPENIADLEAELAVDFAQEITNQDVIRAGRLVDPVAVNNRLVEFIESGNGESIWMTYDFLDDSQDAQNLFVNPYGPADPGLQFAPTVFEEAGGHIQFQLENDLFAALVYRIDESGQRVRADRSPVELAIDAAMATNEVIAGISFFRFGLSHLHVSDEIRPFVEANPTIFSSQVRDIIEEIHVDPEEFERLVERDEERRAEMFERMAVPTDAVIDPVAGVFQYYIEDVSLETAAFEVGLIPEAPEFVAAVAGIPDLAPLTTGTISRAVWDAHFAEVTEATGLGVGLQVP